MTTCLSFFFSTCHIVSHFPSCPPFFTFFRLYVSPRRPPHHLERRKVHLQSRDEVCPQISLRASSPSFVISFPATRLGKASSSPKPLGSLSPLQVAMPSERFCPDTRSLSPGPEFFLSAACKERCDLPVKLMSLPPLLVSLPPFFFPCTGPLA